MLRGTLVVFLVTGLWQTASGNGLVDVNTEKVVLLFVTL